MSHFSLPRFIRVLQNDALRVAGSAPGITVGWLFVTVCVYLGKFPRARPTDDPAHVVMFGVCLISIGLLFTSVAFRDIHHPLRRNHYLMLPCSNLERLLSRYLLTGPLYVLYATLSFMAVDFIGNQLTGMWIHERQLAFSPFTPESLAVVKGYLLAQVVLLIGAICFRSHALGKTILFLVVVLLGAVLVENLAERILFPDLFTWTRFDWIHEPPIELLPWFTAHWMNYAAVIGFFAWLLYVAYLCLRDYEATDGV